MNDWNNDEVKILRYALDHIARTAQASAMPTRRLDWITARARQALNGEEFNPRNLPSGPKIRSELRKELKVANDFIADWNKLFPDTGPREVYATIQVTIDFIDQMRVQGCEGYTLPAEYDTLVSAMQQFRSSPKR